MGRRKESRGREMEDEMEQQDQFESEFTLEKEKERGEGEREGLDFRVMRMGELSPAVPAAAHRLRPR